MQSITGKPVVAIFCGHWHWLHGLVATLNTTASQSIPVFRFAMTTEWHSAALMDCQRLCQSLNHSCGW